MTQDLNSSKPQIDRWASRQLADYDAGESGTLIGEGCRIRVEAQPFGNVEVNVKS